MNGRLITVRKRTALVIWQTFRRLLGVRVSVLGNRKRGTDSYLQARRLHVYKEKKEIRVTFGRETVTLAPSTCGVQ